MGEYKAYTLWEKTLGYIFQLYYMIHAKIPFAIWRKTVFISLSHKMCVQVLAITSVGNSLLLISV